MDASARRQWEKAHVFPFQGWGSSLLLTPSDDWTGVGPRELREPPVAYRGTWGIETAVQGLETLTSSSRLVKDSSS
jgi:hypothetical protein